MFKNRQALKQQQTGHFAFTRNYKKVKRDNYKSVADFWFEIESFVQFQGAFTKHSTSPQNVGGEQCVEVI